MSAGFEELLVWQKSRDFVKIIYEITTFFPEDERYGLISQTRRSAVSIAANIAEGSARGTNKDFARFLLIAIGSAAETKSHILIASDLHYLSSQTLNGCLTHLHEIGKMLRGLRKSILSTKESNIK